ncbi:MAG: radical SAM protein [Syntrophomonadaceae bacterium]|nr:radical SAM protein [Syntrophomonadaceae bacterium]
MRYEGLVYRPPSEANSLIIQATVGCPYNKCAFCCMYRESKFKIRPVSEIKTDLEMARDYYGEEVASVFFADGNTIVMKTKDLVEIFTYAREVFPRLERITVYGSARFIVKKKPEDLRALREAGLKRIHAGMESGDDQVLAFINKGTDRAGVIRAGLMVKEAGIELSEYMIVGVGGKDLSRQHAINSATALNEINPDFIRLRTFMPARGTQMHRLYQSGEFVLLSPHEALMETRLFVEHLEGIESWFLSDHVSNYWDLHGQLPKAKEEMLKEIDYALTLPEASFRDPKMVRL